jgi:predicted acetyltransferase
MAITVRTAERADLPSWVDSLTTAFLQRVDSEKVAEDFATRWDLSRTWGAFEDGRVVGTYRTWDTQLTVPGGAQLPAAAVSAVSVRPTHRRRGVLRQMTAAEHAAIRRRGEVFGLLYAAEFPIYGRFGYGPGTRVGAWTLDTTRTGFMAGDARTVEQLPSSVATKEVVKQIFERARACTVGQIRDRDYRFDFDLGLLESHWEKLWKGWIAVHLDANGEPDGYARYRAEDKWVEGEPNGTITVDTLICLNDDAYASLWRFLAESDWITKVKAEGRPLSERLPWFLTNFRAARLSDTNEGLWVRIFDIPRALAARSYERSGTLVLDVRDGEVEGGHVRVRLDASPSGSECEPTTDAADLELDVSALGAAYLGGTLLSDVVLATGATEHTEGSLETATQLLRTSVEPWCATFF